MNFQKQNKIAENGMYKPLCISLICIKNETAYILLSFNDYPRNKQNDLALYRFPPFHYKQCNYSADCVEYICVLSAMQARGTRVGPMVL